MIRSLNPPPPPPCDLRYDHKVEIVTLSLKSVTKKICVFKRTTTDRSTKISSGCVRSFTYICARARVRVSACAREYVCVLLWPMFQAKYSFCNLFTN